MDRVPVLVSVLKWLQGGCILDDCALGLHTRPNLNHVLVAAHYRDLSLGESYDVDGNVGTKFCADLDVLVVVSGLQERFLKNAHFVVVCWLLCVLGQGRV